MVRQACDEDGIRSADLWGETGHQQWPPEPWRLPEGEDLRALCGRCAALAATLEPQLLKLVSHLCLCPASINWAPLVLSFLERSADASVHSSGTAVQYLSTLYSTYLSTKYCTYQRGVSNSSTVSLLT